MQACQSNGARLRSCSRPASVYSNAEQCAAQLIPPSHLLGQLLRRCLGCCCGGGRVCLPLLSGARCCLFLLVRALLIVCLCHLNAKLRLYVHIVIIIRLQGRQGRRGCCGTSWGGRGGGGQAVAAPQPRWRHNPPPPRSRSLAPALAAAASPARSWLRLPCSRPWPAGRGAHAAGDGGWVAGQQGPCALPGSPGTQPAIPRLPRTSSQPSSLPWDCGAPHSSSSSSSESAQLLASAPLGAEKIAASSSACLSASADCCLSSLSALGFFLLLLLARAAKMLLLMAWGRCLCRRRVEGAFGGWAGTGSGWLVVPGCWECGSTMRGGNAANREASRQARPA